MYIYFLLLTVSFVLKPILNNKKIYFIIVFFTLGMVAGVRSVGVGADTYAYNMDFYSYSSVSFFDALANYDVDKYEGAELGNLLIISLSSMFSQYSQSYIFVSSMLSFFLYGIFLYQNTDNKNYWIAVTLIISMGYYFYSMSTLRQLLATSIAIQCLIFAKNECWIKGLLIIVISVFFHSSAIIFLIPYVIAFVANMCIKKDFDIRKIYIVSLILLVLLCGGVGTLLINNVDLLSKRLAAYTMPLSRHNGASENGIYMWMKFSFYMITIMLALIEVNKINDIRKKLTVFFAAICVGFDCIFLVLKENMLILIRMSYHFEPFFWIICAYAISSISYPYVRCLLYVTFIIISFFTLFYLGINPNSNWEAVPYLCF